MDPTIESLLERFPEQSVDVLGGRITCRYAGAGRPVVLLHGIGSGAGSWVRLLPLLVDRYQCIAWNAPGYGGSTPLAAEHPTAEDYAGALGRFLEAVGIERPVLVGHSLGALMAAAYTADNSDSVAGLVLASPARGHGHRTSEERQVRLATRLDTMEKHGPLGVAERRAGNLLSADADQAARDLVAWNMARLEPAGYAQAARMLSTGNLTDDVKRIATPVLVVCGSADTVTPPSDAEAVAQAAPESTYRQLEGAGHACYVEQPEAFAGLIGEYLEDRP
jgi:pimeloyl-ACP methyl ester carboxylesterase